MDQTQITEFGIAATVTYMLQGKVQHEDFAGHAGT